MIKNVLITGASSGIGLAIAKVLNQQKYKIVITGRNIEKLEKIVKENNFETFFSGDLAIKDSVQNLKKFLIEKNLLPDILINNVGEYIYSPIEKTPFEQVERLIDLNLKTPYLLTQFAISNMKKNNWGRIVNIGSISGCVGEANATLYSMTKSGLMGLTKALALEVATHNITINVINPGWVKTELAQDAVNNSDFTETEELEMIPQHRFIQPEEIANLARYLISEEAKGLTGQYINLCAGLSIG